MKKYLKYIICLISSLGVTASSVVTASSENLYTNISKINNTNNNLKIIQESNEIDDLLKKRVYMMKTRKFWLLLKLREMNRKSSQKKGS